MEHEAARALVAGWIAGAAAGLAITGVAMAVVIRGPAWWGRARVGHLSPPIIGIIVVNVMVFAWTLLGLLLGALYLAAGPSMFRVGLAAAVGGALVIAWVVRGRLTWPMGATAAVALLAFAGLLPLLAG